MLRDRFEYAREELEFPGFVYETAANGYARGYARGLLKLVDLHGITLTPEQRDVLATCQDLALLGAWVDRTFTAKTVADILG